MLVPMVSLLLIGQLAFFAAYAGFQWTVHLVVYPQFSAVAVADFPAYERSHQRRISLVVGPLFAGMAATTGGLLFAHGRGAAWWTFVVPAGALSCTLALTALGAVPLHRQLESGWDATAHRRLQAVDLGRTVAAVVGTASAAAALV